MAVLDGHQRQLNAMLMGSHHDGTLEIWKYTPEEKTKTTGE